MKRFGIKPATEENEWAGCGHPDGGACEGCVMRAARRGRWTLRQLLPLTYRTRYFNSDRTYEWFVVWRMWLGRSFDIETVRLYAE